jgi:NADH dehydrogenase
VAEITRIVILGGGFGGVYTASALEKRIPERERDRFEITLVSRENYITFQPMLPEVISGSVDLLHVISPIRRLAKRTKLYTREVEAIDLEQRVVRLAPGNRPRPLEIPFDHLVIALGNRLDGSRIPGVTEHAIPFKYLGDALRLRNHVVRQLEEASVETDPGVRGRLLTFVVAGGGFSGVECMAELQDFLHDAVTAYRGIDRREIRLILLQRGGRILPEVTETLGRYAEKILRERGVDIRLEVGLKSMSATSVTIEHAKTKAAETIPAATCVATVPSGAHPLLANLAIAEKGRIPVNQFLESPIPGVWALGDCAAVKLTDGSFSPPTAQHALRQARVCARNILATGSHGSRTPFTFTGLARMGSLGRRNAVVEFFGIRMKGLLAWMMWRFVYVTKFPGLDRQVRLAFDFLLDAFLPRDITQLRLFPESAVHREHFEPGELLFSAGDFGDKVYFLLDGEVSVLRDGNVVATLGKGDVAGEAALLSDAPRNATLRAVTPVSVVCVSRAAFEQIIRHVPGVGPEMHRLMEQRNEAPAAGSAPSSKA